MDQAKCKRTSQYPIQHEDKYSAFSAGTIHVSEESHNFLMDITGYIIKPRGEIRTKVCYSHNKEETSDPSKHFLPEWNDELILVARKAHKRN